MVRLKFEENNYFFRCNNGCIKRYTYAEAMDTDFRCPVCNQGRLDNEINKEKVNFLKEMIVQFRNQ